MEVLNALEKVTSNPATDRPLKEIKIINVEMFVLSASQPGGYQELY